MLKSKENDMHSQIRAVNKLELPYIINKLTINSNRLNINEINDSINTGDVISAFRCYVFLNVINFF